MQELHSMMSEFKNIVFEQDPLINHIAQNVEETQNNTEIGVEKIRQAKKMNRFGVL